MTWRGPRTTRDPLLRFIGGPADGETRRLRRPDDDWSGLRIPVGNCEYRVVEHEGRWLALAPDQPDPA